MKKMAKLTKTQRELIENMVDIHDILHLSATESSSLTLYQSTIDILHKGFHKCENDLLYPREDKTE